MQNTTNFYSYLYGQSGVVTFDELADVVELSDPTSIQRAFESYLDDYAPPMDIKEELKEEKFYRSPEEGKNGDETYIRYDVSIPGMEGEVDKDAIGLYFEDFLDKIGAEKKGDNNYEVEVEVTGNERGGVDVQIYVAVMGKQTEAKE